MNLRVVFFLLASFCLAAFGANNLIVNPDMSSDNGIGMPSDWISHIFPFEIGGTLDVHPTDPGAFAFVATGKGSKYIWEQQQLTLQPKGYYVLSCDVRVKHLGAGPVSVYVRNREWNHPLGKLVVTQSMTNGWTHLEQRVQANETSCPAGYCVDIECVPGACGLASCEFRNLSLVASGEAEQAVSKPRPAARTKLPARIVPVDPLLAHVDAATGKMRFYWPGADRVSGKFALIGRADGGRPAKGAFGVDGMADLAMGNLKPGEHRVELAVTDAAGATVATNSYRIVAGVSKPPKAVGRRLNNFVSELKNVPLVDGEVAFERGSDGWVWISFDGGSVDAKGYLDNRPEPVVRRRAYEVRLETQRFVTRGVHTLRVVGAKGGRLRIHAVKEIWTSPPPNLAQVPCDFEKPGGFRYGMPFLGKYGELSTFNTTEYSRMMRDNPGDWQAGYCLERGMRLTRGCAFFTGDPDRTSAERTYRRLRNDVYPGIADLVIDENAINADPVSAVNCSEAVWRLVDEFPRHRIHLFYMDTWMGVYYNEPRLSVSEISSIVNSGEGTGLLCPETYFPVLKDRDSLARYIDTAARFMATSAQMVPGAKDRTILYCASWITPGGWCNYFSPETDIKVHQADLMRAFACDPRFANCGGVGFGGLGYGDEEFRRWGMMVLRHYALEGGTDDLAAKFGYRWNPGFVRNPDFSDALGGWEAKAAEPGHLASEVVSGYNNVYQQRVGGGTGGDSVALFVSTPVGANELSQRLTGLKKGAYYALSFTVGDKHTLTNDCTKEVLFGMLPKMTLTAHLDGATEVRALRYDHPWGCRPRMKFGALRYPIALHNVRYVFRADAETALLRFTDRNEQGEAIPTGRALMLNDVIFRPYYADGEADVGNIIDTLKGNVK